MYPQTLIYAPTTPPEPSPEQAARLGQIGDCIDWAYRHGYCFGERAAEAFAKEHGLYLYKEDLGMYGDKLVFAVLPCE